SVRRYRSKSAKYCSRACLAVERGKAMRGSNHPFWNGGSSRRDGVSRTVIKKAIKLVGKCQKCGEQQNLNGHHIKHWATHPKLRYEISNIEVLCANCHANEHPELSGMLSYPKKKSGIVKYC